MSIRLLKTLFVAFIALLCLALAIQNLVNLEQAYGFFVYVMGNSEHAIYPSSFVPAITNPVLLWAALIVVVGLEVLAGLLAATGAISMWSARNAPVEEFRQAKQNALIGCALGVVVWLGLFGVIAGTFFQMWQTTIGSASLAGAFQYFISCAIVFIIVSMPDE